MTRNESKKQFRIAITIARANGAKYERTAYVSDKPRWDGAWFNEEPEQARIYKTLRGARKYLADRPVIVSHNAGRVEERTATGWEVATPAASGTVRQGRRPMFKRFDDPAAITQASNFAK